MANEAAVARARALRELQTHSGGTASERSADLLGSALRVLIRELPAEVTAAKVNHAPRQPMTTPAGAEFENDSGVNPGDKQPAAAASPAAEPMDRVPTEIERLTDVLLAKQARDREMEQELKELAARREARKLTTQLERDRVASGRGPALPEDRAAHHAMLFSWKPPSLVEAPTVAASTGVLQDASRASDPAE